jgi:hypothetical protein
MPGKRGPQTKSAAKGGLKLPPATRKSYKPKKAPAPTCGAKKRGGGRCNMAAGWGTNHPGIGKCKLHGGALPTHVKAAASQEYRTLMGKPMEIDPLNALVWCIKIRAGEVKWLSDRMAELDEKTWVEDTMVGKQFHLYARERQHAMADLARYSQMAIGLGIAERQVRMAETYGEMLAKYTKGLLDDLWPHLDVEGRAKAPQIVRHHLLLLDGAREDVKQLPATAAA